LVHDKLTAIAVAGWEIILDPALGGGVFVGATGDDAVPEDDMLGHGAEEEDIGSDVVELGFCIRDVDFAGDGLVIGFHVDECDSYDCAGGCAVKNVDCAYGTRSNCYSKETLWELHAVKAAEVAAFGEVDEAECEACC
jgi:hypothetical protein